MKVFVAGATGAIGLPLVRALVARKHKVTGLTRSAEKRRTLEQLGAHDVANATGLFAVNDIKVRLRPYHYFKLGKGKRDFIHIFGYIMEGRSIEQKENLSRRIIERLNEMFPAIAILSINIGEFEKATYSNKALIHPLNTTSDRHFNIED